MGAILTIFLPQHWPHDVLMTHAIIGACTSFALSMFLVILFVGDIAWSFNVHVSPISIGYIGSNSFLVQLSELCI